MKHKVDTKTKPEALDPTQLRPDGWLAGFLGSHCLVGNLIDQAKHDTTTANYLRLLDEADALRRQLKAAEPGNTDEANRLREIEATMDAMDRKAEMAD